MNLFRGASIQQKQMRIIMGICILALLLASAGFVTHDSISRRNGIAAFLLTRCDLLGRTCMAALDFNDPEAAEENLSALQADPRMISATVFRADGKFFARYLRGNAAAPAPVLVSSNAVTAFERGQLRAARPIMRGDEHLGFIVLESDLEALYTAMKYQGGIAALVLTLALALAYFLSFRLQRLISAPILGLLETTRAVATSRDYALRAHKESADELGQLVDGFNDMLQQVQSRDAELQQAQNLLEKRVEDRTVELRIEVAERRRSEQTVLESQQFLQSTLDALSAHIAILDESGVIVSVNSAWNRFALANNNASGLGAGRNYLEVCDHSRGEYSEEGPAVARGIRAVLAGETGEFRLEYPCHSPDEKRWFIVRVTSFGAEGARRVVIAHENITERRKADDERARLVDFLEASLHEVYVFDPETLRFSYVNGSARQNLGFTMEQLSKLTPLDLKPGFSEETFRHAIRPLLEGTVFKHVFQTVHRRADGTEYPVEVCLQLVATGSERVLLAVVDNITERKRAEAELMKAQNDLVAVSREAGMAEIATGVLHNVGNVLNSVNVSANLVSDQVRKTPVADLGRVVALLREQGVNLGAFFSNDPRGPKVINLLAELAGRFARQQENQLKEVASLRKNVEHIKDIVAMQQSYAKVSGLNESLSPLELIEDALRMSAGSLQKHEVELVRELPASLATVCVDKHKVLQILVNLLRNAKHACDDASGPDKRITVRATCENGRVLISLTDNGVGIPAENLNRVFNHGFTTKKDGHGFGLHTAANAAKEMGGRLTAMSAGPGLGAAFTLELPVERPRSGDVEPGMAGARAA